MDIELLHSHLATLMDSKEALLEALEIPDPAQINQSLFDRMLAGIKSAEYVVQAYKDSGIEDPTGYILLMENSVKEMMSMYKDLDALRVKV